MSKQSGLFYDATVIGAGLVGASIAAFLSDNGRRVLLVEAFDQHHEFGSSHGMTRATRLFGWESPEFPQMARDGMSMIRERFPTVAITPMPTLFLTEGHSQTHAEMERFAHAQGLAVTTLSSGEVQQRYGLSVPEGQIGIIDANSATFDPYTLLDLLYAKVEASGGSVLFGRRAAGWQRETNKVSVQIEDASVRASELVIAAGAWTPEVLKNGRGALQQGVIDSLSTAMVVERTPIFYFEYPTGMPDAILIELSPEGSVIDGGLPGAGQGENLELWAVPEVLPNGRKAMKAGFYYGNEVVTDPDRVDRTIGKGEISRAIAYVRRWIPEARFSHAAICMNHRAVDRDVPLVGALPGTNNVYVASFTGYAARYALALGKAVSEMMQGRGTGI